MLIRPIESPAVVVGSIGYTHGNEDTHDSVTEKGVNSVSWPGTEKEAE